MREPPSSQPRRYGFRELKERRFGQDRRLYGAEGGWDRRRTDAFERFVTLTREELIALLADLDE